MHRGPISSPERSELWYGPSYAYRFSPPLSFGISAFLSVINASAETETTVIEGDVVVPIASTGEAAANPMLRQQQRSIDINIKRFIFRVGALYKPSRVVSLGLMFQTPSLHIKGKGDIRDRITTIDGPTNLGTFTQVKRDLSAEVFDPWEIRAGLGYHPLSWLTFSLDASAYGPTGSARSLQVHESASPDDVEPTLGARCGHRSAAHAHWRHRSNLHVVPVRPHQGRRDGPGRGLQEADEPPQEP